MSWAPQSPRQFQLQRPGRRDRQRTFRLPPSVPNQDAPGEQRLMAGNPFAESLTLLRRYSSGEHSRSVESTKRPTAGRDSYSLAENGTHRSASARKSASSSRATSPSYTTRFVS